jgi:magnesium chelatase subunit H
VPENENGRTRVKLVYVVLEAQYQSALSAAVRNINAKNSSVCFEVVGYLLEELRDSSNFEAFQRDVATANIFIGSLIFIEELAEKVCAMGERITSQQMWSQACLLSMGVLLTTLVHICICLHASYRLWRLLALSGSAWTPA